jgi:hypothetical protein
MSLQLQHYKVACKNNFTRLHKSRRDVDAQRQHSAWRAVINSMQAINVHAAVSKAAHADYMSTA